MKLAVSGKGGVGKTTLVQRYVTGTFNAGTKITIGVDFHTKSLSVDGSDVILQVWDFGGEERFRFILPTYSNGAKGAIFVYDVTNLESLLHAGEWLKLVRSEAGAIPVVMVGTKADLGHLRVVDPAEAEAVAWEFGIAQVFEASSKTGNNVEEVFETITHFILDGSA